ncbi:MAG: asparagine synthase C-terminal domain-containing protein [Flavobacteriales bacterium]|nr:asparagine synthase C-terminal domain-containing protein [Flavobacteriales bacterium]
MNFYSQIIRTPIVPPVVSYYRLPGDDKLDYPSICCFAALGFFLEDDTYFTNCKAFRPSTIYEFNDRGDLVSKQRYFEWHYSPRQVSFEEALYEFSQLLENIVAQDTEKKSVVLPISGGLDSRTLAAVVSHRKDVFSYSYQLDGGIHENKYGAAVAKLCGFSHRAFIIREGYLWDVIDKLACLNGCYAEFLNPRQMAVYGEFSDKGDIFLLGHGGDLFFDGMGVPHDFTEAEQHQYLINKLIKPSGFELGKRLWDAWGLTGDFKEYLFSRILTLLRTLKIEDANARLRAFKTEYYVARWTAVNLAIFQNQLPVSIPFFHDEMCKFICSVPEAYLSSRKLQIAYIIKKKPALATVPWQKFYPCNLYNYNNFNSPSVMLKRAGIKISRELAKHFFGNQADKCNWELQFYGNENERHLREHLFKSFGRELFPREILHDFYRKFQQQGKLYIHALSMLLTLVMFQKHYLNKL